MSSRLLTGIGTVDHLNAVLVEDDAAVVPEIEFIELDVPSVAELDEDGSVHLTGPSHRRRPHEDDSDLVRSELLGSGEPVGLGIAALELAPDRSWGVRRLAGSLDDGTPIGVKASWP